jgi:hypothetical protein
MHLIPRHIALKDPIFADFIYHWQHINRPKKEDFWHEEGEYFDEALNKTRFYSQAELEGIYQNALDEFKAITDPKPDIDSKTEGILVIDAPENTESIDYFTDLLVKLTETHSLEWLAVPLFKTNWFNEEAIKNLHPDTKANYKALKTLFGRAHYDGGISLYSSQDLSRFIPLYFNLVTGQYLPYGFIYAKQLQAVFSYHYSGELWCYCLSKDGMEMVMEYIKSNQLQLNARSSFF